MTLLSTPSSSNLNCPYIIIIISIVLGAGGSDQCGTREQAGPGPTVGCAVLPAAAVVPVDRSLCARITSMCEFACYIYTHTDTRDGAESFRD